MCIRDRRPVVPFPDVDVRAADRGLADPDHHVVVTDRGLLDGREYEAGRPAQLGQCFHGVNGSWVGMRTFCSAALILVGSRRSRSVPQLDHWMAPSALPTLP